MNIEKHLTSYELSKALHDAGFVRESVFVWIEFDNLSCVCSVDGCECVKGKYHTKRFTAVVMEEEIDIYKEEAHLRIVNTVPAYLSSELGEVLPYHIYVSEKKYDNHWTVRFQNEKGICLVSYERPIYDKKKGKGTEFLGSAVDDTEANARAKMILYLLEHKLVTLEELLKKT